MKNTMAKKTMTVQHKVQKGVGLYGTVIKKDRKDREITIENKLIADLDMFGKCILCQLHDEMEMNQKDILNQILDILEENYVVMDKRVQKYRLDEVIPSEPDDGVSLLFMRIAYVAFIKSQMDMALLKLLVDVSVIGYMRIGPDYDVEQMKIVLSKGYENRYQFLEDKYFGKIGPEKIEFRKLWKNLKEEMSNLESMQGQHLCKPEIFSGDNEKYNKRGTGWL